MKTTITLKALLVIGLFAIACEPSKTKESYGTAEEINADTLDIRGSIIGKWNSTAILSDKPVGTWEFQTDGTFRSTGDYFRTKDGRFRTHENKSVVFIEIDEVTTEWRMDVEQNGILLEEVTDGTKNKPSQFLLTKIEQPLTTNM